MEHTHTHTEGGREAAVSQASKATKEVRALNIKWEWPRSVNQLGARRSRARRWGEGAALEIDSELLTGSVGWLVGWLPGCLVVNIKTWELTGSDVKREEDAARRGDEVVVVAACKVDASLMKIWAAGRVESRRQDRPLKNNRKEEKKWRLERKESFQTRRRRAWKIWRPN